MSPGSPPGGVLDSGKSRRPFNDPPRGLPRIGDNRIVLARNEQGYVSFDDRCSHKGGSLADGVLICRAAQFPWHGSQFDIQSGGVKAGPADKPIATYRVEVGDDEDRLLLT